MLRDSVPEAIYLKRVALSSRMLPMVDRRIDLVDESVVTGQTDGLMGVGRLWPGVWVCGAAPALLF